MNLKDYILEAVSHGRKHTSLDPSCSVKDLEDYLDLAGIDEYTGRNIIVTSLNNMKPVYQIFKFSSNGENSHIWICLPKINIVYEIDYQDNIIERIGIYTVFNKHEQLIDAVVREDGTKFVVALNSIKAGIEKEMESK